MLMSYWDGAWTMRMPHTDDVGWHEVAAESGSVSTEGDAANQPEKYRGLQQFARKMDRVLLSWAQATRRPEGGASDER